MDTLVIISHIYPFDPINTTFAACHIFFKHTPETSLPGVFWTLPSTTVMDIKEKLINLFRDDIIRVGRKKNNRGWSTECAKFHLLQNHFCLFMCVSNLGKVPLFSLIVLFWQQQEEIGHGKYNIVVSSNIKGKYPANEMLIKWVRT